MKSKKPKTNINLLHLIDSGGIGGAAAVLLSLMEEQKKNNIDVILGSIATKDIEEKYIESEALKRGIDVKKFRMGKGLNVFGALRIVKYAKEKKIDIIQSHGYKANIFMGLVPSWYRKIPYIHTFHGWTSLVKFGRIWFYEWLEAIMARRAAKSVVVSRAMLKNARVLKTGLNPICIHNGINIESLKEDAKTVFYELPKIRGSFVIGAIGRLSGTKGFDLLIKGFKKVVESGRDVSLIIVGDGVERQNLENLTQSLGVVSRVFFLGFRKRAHKYIKDFDIFVLSSHTEGMPITILEALHYEVPIISTNVGGIPELLSNGKYGLLISPGSDDAIAEAIIKVHDDPILRRKMRNGNREWVKKEFSSEAMELQYRKLYESLLL